MTIMCHFGQYQTTAGHLLTWDFVWCEIHK